MQPCNESRVLRFRVIVVMNTHMFGKINKNFAGTELHAELHADDNIIVRAVCLQVT